MVELLLTAKHSNGASAPQVPANSKVLKSGFPLTCTRIKSGLKQIITDFKVLKVNRYILKADFCLQGVYKDISYLIELHEHFGNTY